MNEVFKDASMVLVAVLVYQWLDNKIDSMIGYAPLVCNLLVKVKPTGDEYEETAFFCRECGKMITDIGWDRCPRCGKKIRWKGVKSEEEKNDPE